MIGHLAECADCAGRLAAVVRSASGEVREPSVDLATFRAAGLRSGEELRTPRAVNWRRLALAAAVILAVGSTVYFTRLGEPTSVERGDAADAVSLSAPIGEIDGQAPLRFVWTGTTGPVRLVVVDIEGGAAPLIDRNAQDGPFTLAAGDRARLLNGREYRWFLEYRARDGGIRSTPTARFSLR